MNGSIKRALAVGLCASLLSMPLPVSARSAQADPELPPDAVEWYAYEISPRLTCFHFVDASISRKDSTITCTAAISPREGYTFSYVIRLDKSTDAESWSLVDSSSFTGSGNTAKGTTKKVAKGYYYRVTVSAVGIDADGKEYAPAIVHSANLDYRS